MEEFASSAMMRLMAAGLARQGLEAPMDRAGPGAHVALSSKRSALRAIADQHGPVALLRIGEALQDLKDEPVMAAMEAASTPQDVMERWRRLESYAHAKHRTRVESSDHNRLVIRHYTKDSGPPPLREEDLLIFGVIVGLVRWIGATDVQARPVDANAWVFNDNWRAPAKTDDVALWEICWRNLAEVEDKGPPREVRTSLADVLGQDLTRRWTIERAARELAMSTRSLQRKLASEGKTYSQVTASARASGAVRLLDQGKLGLGEIGFICGYSDQAHFTRSFRDATGTTPHAFRERMNAAEFRERPGD